MYNKMLSYIETASDLSLSPPRFKDRIKRLLLVLFSGDPLALYYYRNSMTWHINITHYNAKFANIIRGQQARFYNSMVDFSTHPAYLINRQLSPAEISQNLYLSDQINTNQTLRSSFQLPTMSPINGQSMAEYTSILEEDNRILSGISNEIEQNRVLSQMTGTEATQRQIGESLYDYFIRLEEQNSFLKRLINK
ncbi:MAG: hypothetical protein LBL50_05000 [Candidatus Margulisbacteria bacterium]|jgi:hypothetical protein|nr:hypothetical protein [Candidatus Margulisiibacteriota bacterium]